MSKHLDDTQSKCCMQRKNEQVALKLPTFNERDALVLRHFVIICGNGLSSDRIFLHPRTNFKRIFPGQFVVE